MRADETRADLNRFSTLQRVEIAEIFGAYPDDDPFDQVSVLFNESKLLKLAFGKSTWDGVSFSTLQRVEIAEINRNRIEVEDFGRCFSTLQRVEIAENKTVMIPSL